MSARRKGKVTRLRRAMVATALQQAIHRRGFAPLAGALTQALGGHALKLLDAQAAPPAPTPIRKPRVRTAKRRAA
jgi:hypothetical protein